MDKALVNKMKARKTLVRKKKVHKTTLARKTILARKMKVSKGRLNTDRAGKD